ncbi:aromatic motif membrane protein [Mycoplasmopsis ciconiae]|uniref:Aromatic motif membrane protein n=1 Tax=Mycoplasmopsis ciconiae TaxID=561067 RepID=A0ABU7MLP6_9BACT|nr:aromatic motif membrane protein [Mycoplasmopsis ciconiae]
MKFKILSLFLALSHLPFVTLSCSNSESFSNISHKYIDNSLNFNPKKEDQINNSQILDVLLKSAFKNKNAQRIKFLDEQNSKNKKSAFIKKYNELIQKYDQKVEGSLQEINDLFSNNWYFILNNLDLFNGQYEKILIFESWHNKGRHSQSYLDFANNSFKPQKYIINDSKLEKIQEGDESFEIPDSEYFYLLKDKMVFRIQVKNTGEVILSPFVWTFVNAKNSISLKFISDIVHGAYIHGDQKSYDEFENDLVKKYKAGVPLIYMLRLKNENI